MICSILMTFKCANWNTFEYELKVSRCLGMQVYVVRVCEINLFLSENCGEFCIRQYLSDD